MGLANYRVFGKPNAWRVEHDGKAENTYATQEAAFEAAVAAASLALRQGHEVVVTAPGSHGDEATTDLREARKEKLPRPPWDPASRRQ
jgi:phosphotransferase system HPr-like phosphotransfer protein